MERYYENNTVNKGANEMQHDIIMRGRRAVEITGVKQVESFDNEEFLLETSMGYLSIRGQNLSMKNLDVDKGNVSIKGKVYDIVYLDEQSTEKAKGFFSKLFK
jgi:sporulation protein YabP